MNHDTMIFDEIDPEIKDQLVARRNFLVKSGKLAMLGIAVSSVPLTFASLTQSVFAQSGLPQQIVDVLNFALTLEYLEAEFYSRGLASGNVPSGDRTVIEQISRHETAHVALLIQTLGSQAVAKPTFDFTAGGVFADPFASGNYTTFLALAQAFEDTGVRAYKGQASELMSNNDILTVALQIHSVEARHAAEIRSMRGQKGWITGSSIGDLPAATQPIYNGEDNTNQGGVTVTDTQAFDEPLTKQAVLDIASLFIQ